MLRYGNARDLCLGLEVVTAQGEVWDGLSGLRKDNTGYDLRDLFIGSEGTLGIITAATLKLYPQPAAQLTAWAAVPSLDAAVALLGLAHQHLGAGLTGFEVMGQFALSLVAKHFPQLRVPLPGSAPWMRAAGELRQRSRSACARARSSACWKPRSKHGCVSDAVVAESLAQAHALWHMRESIPLAQAEEGLNIKHDISLPVSRIPAFVARTDAALRRAFPGVRLVNFGHLGDGNLHYNVQAPEGVRRRRPSCDEHEARGQHAGLRRGGALRRLDLGRARRRQPQARQAGAAQVAGGAGDDARHQAGARPAEPDEPGPGAVAAVTRRSARRCHPLRLKRHRHRRCRRHTPFFGVSGCAPPDNVCIKRAEQAHRTQASIRMASAQCLAGAQLLAGIGARTS